MFSINKKYWTIGLIALMMNSESVQGMDDPLVEADKPFATTSQPTISPEESATRFLSENFQALDNKWEIWSQTRDSLTKALSGGMTIDDLDHYMAKLYPNRIHDTALKWRETLDGLNILLKIPTNHQASFVRNWGRLDTDKERCQGVDSCLEKLAAFPPQQWDEITSAILKIDPDVSTRRCTMRALCDNVKKGVPATVFAERVQRLIPSNTENYYLGVAYFGQIPPEHQERLISLIAPFRDALGFIGIINAFSDIPTHKWGDACNLAHQLNQNHKIGGGNIHLCFSDISKVFSQNISNDIFLSRAKKIIGSLEGEAAGIIVRALYRASPLVQEALVAQRGRFSFKEEGPGMSLFISSLSILSHHHINLYGSLFRDSMNNDQRFYLVKTMFFPVPEIHQPRIEKAAMDAKGEMNPERVLEIVIPILNGDKDFQ